MALNGTALVYPQQAKPRGDYLCPECLSVVDLHKAGENHRPHFSHRADVSRICSPETVEHKTAKMLIADCVRRQRENIVVRRECCWCERRVAVPLDERVNGATVEHRMANGIIPDVTLLRDGEPIIFVEVWMHHRVPSEKASAMSNWLEVRAGDILREPLRWTPVVDKLAAEKPECDKCARRWAAIERHRAEHEERKRIQRAELEEWERRRQEELRRQVEEERRRAKEAESREFHDRQSVLRDAATGWLYILRSVVEYSLNPKGELIRSLQKQGMVVVAPYAKCPRLVKVNITDAGRLSLEAGLT